MRGAPRVRDDVVLREVGDAWVLYDPQARRLHELNLTGALVWTFCDGRRTVEDLVTKVRDSLAEAPGEATVQRDVEGLLEAFADAGLLA